MTAEQKKRRFWKRVIVFAIAWIFVLPLALLLIFGVVGFHAAHAPAAPKTQIPNLRGLQVEAARNTSHQAGFKVEVAGKDLDSGEQPGTITNQEPRPGTPYPVGTVISVLIAEKDPYADFWDEQRRIHREYERRGFFKDFNKNRR
jgi:hypothetical protein